MPPVQLVQITDELIQIENRLATACAGLAHGSRNASTNCSGKLGFGHGDYHRHPMNRLRVASLAVLYGLAFAADHQMIVQLGGEPLIFSVDHGHFLPNGPCWNAAGLTNAAGATVDGSIQSGCAVTPEELAEPLNRLRALVETDIALAVATPPDEWFFPESDRIAVARYLWDRREAILRSVA